MYSISSSYIFTYLTRSSGVFGRTVHELMTDLISLLARLVDPTGNILVPGVDDMVQAAAVEER
jgi:Cys-Gly metallodipeptidase DUG1